MSSESVLKGAGAAQPLATRSTRTAASTFEPFIPASARLRELTAPPLIVGTLLGIIFGASSLYLVLKVGLTVSASIPVAVISITLFRALSRLGFRDATILENNIVQTAGSAERLLGAQAGSDVNSYKVVHKTTTEFEPAGRYLVNDQGAPVYLADPGINGVYTTVPGSGQTVTKFSAPKATLMSYIIKGVLGGDLPWALIPPWDDDCDNAGVGGHFLAGVRGRDVPADFDVDADLAWRCGAMGRRSIPAYEAGESRVERGRDDGQDRPESRRAPSVGIHRGRDARGCGLQLSQSE